LTNPGCIWLSLLAGSDIILRVGEEPYGPAESHRVGDREETLVAVDHGSACPSVLMCPGWCAFDRGLHDALEHSGHNAASQAAVVMASFSRATVFGWGGEGGDYCFATLFTRQGEPWATYALWLDAPTPGFQFGRNTTGLRYGTGELGAEVPVAANAVVQMNGSLGSL
jgi:hypothetical protein